MQGIALLLPGQFLPGEWSPTRRLDRSNMGCADLGVTWKELPQPTLSSSTRAVRMIGASGFALVGRWYYLLGNAKASTDIWQRDTDEWEHSSRR